MAEPKHRLSIDLNRDGFEEVKALLQKSRCNTHSELFRKSLALFEFVIDAQASKARIVLEKPDGTRELVRLL